MHHPDPPATARLFWTGRSQAVRLPRAFRMEGESVRIRRVGATVVLEPIPANWDWLDKLQPLSDDFIAEGREQPHDVVPGPVEDTFD